MSEHQPYDHALKSLMGDRAAEIIPQLLPEAEVVSEENIEIKRELLNHPSGKRAATRRKSSRFILAS